MSAEGDADTGRGYTEWRCANCGRGSPKRNPPCNRCGSLEFEQVEVRAGDFAEEISGPSTRELLRDNALTVGAGLAILLVGGTLVLAGAGAFVVSDPLGLGYRYGAVEPTAPDGDGTLTAAELGGRVAEAHGDASLSWYGRQLRLSYRSGADSNGALAAELTTVAAWYADYVGDGGAAASLRVTARIPGEGRVRVTVARADAAAFAAGDISRAEYRSRVLGGS